MTTPDPHGLQLLELDDPEHGLLAYRLHGKVTEAQAHAVFERIAAAAEEHRKLRIYYEIEGFPWAEGSVFLEKLHHLRDIFQAVERVAIVGDQRWLEVYVKLFDPLTKIRVRHFHPDQRDAALAWLKEA